MLCQKGEPPDMCPQLSLEVTQRVNEHSQAEERWVFKDLQQLYPSYRFQDILKHNAVVVFPYVDGSFGVTEMYAMGIPMFLPSAKFLVSLCHGQPQPCYVNKSVIAAFAEDEETFKNGIGCGDALNTAASYSSRGCPRHEQWTANLSRLGKGGGEGIHPFPGPEAACAEPQHWPYWLQFVDAYRWPHVVTFSSWRELAELLEDTDFAQLHALMRGQAARRARRVRKTWCKVLNEALQDSPRQIPESYEAALAELGIGPEESLLVL